MEGFCYDTCISHCIEYVIERIDVMFISYIEYFFLERNSCVLNLKHTFPYLGFFFFKTELNYSLYVFVRICMHIQDANLN